jgi:hypothetical protein
LRNALRSAAGHYSRLKRATPGVAVGSYATLLFVLGMTYRLAELADPKNDAHFRNDVSGRGTRCRNAGEQTGKA